MTGNARNVALVGAGGMGRRWARVLSALPGVRLRVVCDRDVSLAETVASGLSGCRVTTDWNAAARDPDIDIAVIALPHHLLARASADFVKRGIHVLCEKPGGISSAEVKRVMTLAKRHGVRYMVGFNHRFHDAYVKMRRLFVQGVIGRPLFIRARYGFGGRPGYEKEWRLNPRLSGGGELIDQGSHVIDLARLYLGDFVRVAGFTDRAFWRAQGEDNAFALLKTAQGRVAALHVSLTNWKPEHVFELYGTKGYLIVEGLGKKYGGRELLKVGIRPALREGRGPGLREKIIACDTDADASLAREFRAFQDAITRTREPEPGGRDAFVVLKIVEKIYRANR